MRHPMPHPKPRPRASKSRPSTRLRPEKRVYRTVQFRLWHVGDAGEDVGEPSLRIDFVKFCGLDERVDEVGRSASRSSQHAALAIDSAARGGQALRLMRWAREPRRRRFSLAAAAILGLALRPGVAAAPASDASAESAMLERACAACHAIPTTRAPTRSSMRAMSPSFIVDALTSGVMKAQGSALTSEERVAVFDGP
jgi:cytochrome c553